MTRRIDSILDHTIPMGDCLIWQGYVDRLGYGHVGQRGLAHRLAYIEVHGSIPGDLPLDHLCRVPACVNPEHLEPVTQRENLARGNGFIGRQARATHCPKGHAYDESNTYVLMRRTGYPFRQCRACKRERREAIRSTPEGRRAHAEEERSRRARKAAVTP